MSAHDRSGTGDRGQALIEFGVVVVLFVTLVLGVVTFGHAFMVMNMITHAARDGARIAATWPERGNCGVLTNTDPIRQKVKDEIETVSGETFHVAVSQNPPPPADKPCGAPTTPTVQVNVQGCVAYVFPILPKNIGTACPSGRVGFAVNRTVVFHDEGLGG
jgi:hypothetical protein